MSTNANLYACMAARFAPHARCIETPDGACFSYAEVDQWSARAASALIGLGLRAGDRVAVVAEKSVQLLWLYLGCLRAGCVYHPLNPSYTAAELKFFLHDSGSRLVVCEPDLSDRVAAAAEDCRALEYRLTLGADGTFTSLSNAAASEFATHRIDSDAIAALLYSSGTTGKPKGIALTHGNLLANALTLADAWAFSAADVLLHALPLYHVHGLFITLGPALLAGCRIRFLPRFEPNEVVAALPGATIMAGVPTYYSRLLNTAAFTRESTRDIRVFISGSAPLSEATFHAFKARTAHDILERYGMTETGINTSNPLRGQRKPGAVGPALAGVDLRVVNEHGVPLAVDEIGEIEVRGPNVFHGYWGLPDKTAEAFSGDGYFRTGDQGSIDADGYLHIAGRSKDMIISGGLNVYPKEIERELEACAGVEEAAVFGLPHPDYGEAVVAAVTSTHAELSTADLLHALRKCLAGYKLPKHIFVVEAFPRNSMGKVQKNLLRQAHASLFTSDSL